MTGLEAILVEWFEVLIVAGLLLIPFWILNGALHNDKT